MPSNLRADRSDRFPRPAALALCSVSRVDCHLASDRLAARHREVRHRSWSAPFASSGQLFVAPVDASSQCARTPARGQPPSRSSIPTPHLSFKGRDVDANPRSHPALGVALFALLLALGLSPLVGRRASLRRASVLPLAMTGLSLYGTLSVFAQQPGYSPAGWRGWSRPLPPCWRSRFLRAPPTTRPAAASRCPAAPGR